MLCVILDDTHKEDREPGRLHDAGDNAADHPAANTTVALGGHDNFIGTQFLAGTKDRFSRLSVFHDIDVRSNAVPRKRGATYLKVAKCFVSKEVGKCGDLDKRCRITVLHGEHNTHGDDRAEEGDLTFEAGSPLERRGQDLLDLCRTVRGTRIWLTMSILRSPRNERSWSTDAQHEPGKAASTSVLMAGAKIAREVVVLCGWVLTACR